MTSIKYRLERDRRIYALFQQGNSPRHIAEVEHLSKRTIYTILTAFGITFSVRKHRVYND